MALVLYVQSKSMTAELLAYNPVLHVLAYMRIFFNWQKDGSIDAR